MKTCSKCNINKAYDAFYKQTSSVDGRAYYCKKCDNERRKEWRTKNKVRNHETQRNTNLLKRYGITLDQYEKLFSDQGSMCGICGTKENYSGHLGPRKDWSFSVDHCHKTGVIRGLLCNDCNRALGLFKDDKRLLQAAILWLDTKDV